MGMTRYAIRASFWIKAAVAVALIALGDRLFYVMGNYGSAFGAFAAAWLVGTVLVHPALRRDRRALAAAGLAAFYAAAMFDDPSLLALTLFGAALVMAVLLPRSAQFDNALRWAARLLLHAVVSGFGPLRDLFRLRRLPRTGSSVRASVPVLALPLIGGGIFLWLFAQANPLIGNALASLALPTPDLDTILRLLLWAILLVLVWSTLRPRRPRWLNLAMPVADLKAMPGVSVASVTLSLIVFNALFALQNALDLVFLWSGAGLPDGVTLAEYVHRGAYPLIATALLAGLFVLVALRPGSATADAPLLRRLVTMWVAQNIFLVASSILRTFDYIEVYSLTRLRIAALLWMGLVAVGLALILWRMLRAKSASWLINANAVNAGIVLSACTVVDLGSVAATWNVRHAREVGGRGAALDLCYLERLGPSALVALVELEQRKLAPTFRQRVAVSRSGVLNGIRFDQDHGGWTWRSARRLGRAAQIGGNRVLGKVILSELDCTGRPIEYPKFMTDAPPARPALPPPPPARPARPLTKAPGQ